MIESESCISSPISVLKDCSVLGSAVWSGKPNEYRCHSAPSRRTPIFVRGVNTTWRSESISSKSLTRFPPRWTSPSPTYVASAENSPDNGQNDPLLSSESAGPIAKIRGASTKGTDRKANTFIFLSAKLTTRIRPKDCHSFVHIFHHH